MGYFFMAIPSGILARRFGYKGAIIIGLALVAAGAFWFIPATHIGTYWAFLLGLFILAAGLTCLETVANPYTTVLGRKESSAVRINLAQSGNGVGWMIGPVLGGFFVLSATGEANTSNADLYKPYLIVGLVVSLLTLVFIFAKVPDLNAEEECKVEGGPARAAVKPLFQRRHFVLAVAAQFFYVAAQTGVFSYFVNYIHSDTPALSEGLAKALPANMTALTDGTYHITDRGAGELLSFAAFGLFLLGRFTGSFALRFVKAHSMLAWYAVANVLMMVLIMFPLGWWSVTGLFLSFFFMSIMYPTIFALGIAELGPLTSKGSGVITIGNVGGAVIPPLFGALAVAIGYQHAFILPIICYLYVAYYGLSGYKPTRAM
jgi:FHS family L-fucose permease-like MFS transporter